MTIEEFDKQGWTPGMTAKVGPSYGNGHLPIASCDFEEKLIGVTGAVQGADEDEITWLRCENVEYVTS